MLKIYRQNNKANSRVKKWAISLWGNNHRFHSVKFLSHYFAP